MINPIEYTNEKTIRIAITIFNLLLTIFLLILNYVLRPFFVSM